MFLSPQLVPVALVRAYQRAMLNIHPSLLPAFGGKGFYGDRFHKCAPTLAFPIEVGQGPSPPF